MLKLFEILVPCQTNEGKPVRTRQHREWDSRVRRITGGLSVFPPIKGQWKHGDDLYAERMIPVRVSTTDENMDKIADMTAKFYGQLAVMYYTISTEVTIKHYE